MALRTLEILHFVQDDKQKVESKKWHAETKTK